MGRLSYSASVLFLIATKIRYRFGKRCGLGLIFLYQMRLYLACYRTSNLGAP
jgi:hypothetical protein